MYSFNTINKIENKGIKVFALRNLQAENNEKNVEELKTKFLDEAFDFGKAVEPYELRPEMRRAFWEKVKYGREDEAEQLVLNTY